MATIGSLSVKLGLVTVEWDKATDKAKRQAKDLQNAFNNLGKELNFVQKAFGSAFGGLNLVGLGIAGLATSAIGLSRDMQDMSDSFGVSTSKLLEYRAALEMSGVSAENTAKVMASLFSKIGEVQSGENIKLLGYLNKMGISLNEIAHLSPEQALERFAKGLLTIDNVFERSKIKEMFMAKGSKTFSPEAFLSSLDKVKGGYDKTAESVKRLADLDDKLKTNMQNLKIAFADILGTFVGEKGLIISVDKFKIILEAVFGIYMIKAVKSFTLAVYEVAAAMVVLKNVTLNLIPGTGQFLKFLSIVGALGDKTPGMKEFIATIEKLKSEVEQPIAPTVKVDAEDNKLNEDELNRKYYSDYEARLDLLKAQITNEKELRQIKLDSYRVDEFTTKSREQQLKFEEKILQIKQEWEKEAKSKMGDELEYVNKIYKKRIELAIEANETEKTLLAKQREVQMEFTEGWKDAFNQYQLDAKNYGKMGADAFNSFTSSLESGIERFIRTGKFGFKEFANSVISEIVRMQARIAASKIMDVFKSAGNSVSSIFGFADGGDPPVGQVSLVGERGPELFVPKQSGTIIPNNALGSMMGNQPQVVYNGPYIANMNAMDTQSATQFLSKNRQAVYAANLSATRGLPQSR